LRSLFVSKHNPNHIVSYLLQTFSEHLLLADKQTFRPKAVFFDYLGNKKFGLSSRPYNDIDDLYTVVSEMMYAYSGFNAGSSILVLDSNLNDDGQDSSGALVIYFVSSDSACCVKLYYKHSLENTIEWIESKDSHELIDTKSQDSTNRIIEILFVHSHLDKPPFTKAELLSYYSMKGYNFRSFKDLKTSYLDYSFKA
jgi:hypothetical protein